MSNFNQFFVDQVTELVTRSNDKFSCIEDQFYYVDRFPKYEQDDETVFKCSACDCLLHVDCLEECDICEKNFCAFNHTSKSICKKPHNCASFILKEFVPRHHFGAKLACVRCIQDDSLASRRRDRFIFRP